MILLTTFLFAVSTSASALPPGEGKPIVERMCSSCHALKVVTSKRASPEQWAQLVDQMVSRGAEGTDDEIETVVEYLSKNFGLDNPPPATEKSAASSVNANQATAAELSAALELPPAQGEAIVAYRQQNGKFKDWHDLTKVPGIDASKIEANKDHLVF
jgi:competence protein ComEA